MRQARAGALEEGLAVTFPFTAGHVEAIHTSFHKYGHGVYFRVFSAFGMKLDPNPARHDSAPATVSPSPTRSHPATDRTS